MAKHSVLVLVAAIVISSASGGESQEPVPSAFSKWLGPQENEKYPGKPDRWVVADPVVERVITQKDHPRLSKYEISLSVVKGSQVRVPESANALLVFDGKSFQRIKQFEPRRESKYVFGKISLKAEYGWRIYTLNVRVTKGRLKGAIVHLWDGKVPDSIEDPYISAFEIPAQFELAEGPMEFEIVSFYAI
jgi:hypothetical protein